MNKNLTDLIFVLDMSGSMYGLTDDTIGGFNSMIDKQKKEDGEVVVTTALFNDKVKFIHDRFDINDVKPMDDRQYVAGGCTALLDAVGTAIQKEVAVQRNLPETSRAEKVIFVIITDGYENASREYSYNDIKKMIESEQEKNGWEFMFLGANIDAASEGAKIGIRRDRSVRYKSDSEGTALNYNVVGETVARMRNMKCGEVLSDEWMAPIEEDVKKRGL